MPRGCCRCEAGGLGLLILILSARRGREVPSLPGSESWVPLTCAFKALLHEPFQPLCWCPERPAWCARGGAHGLEPPHLLQEQSFFP